MTAAIVEAFSNAEGVSIAWPEPRSLPGGLLAVDQFDCALLPEGFRPWVEDISERMQTPPEFVAVPAMVAAGSVIGRKLAIRPMRHDDWQEVPNLWGCIVGRPGVMKSPAVKAALKPLSRLEAQANDEFQTLKTAWDEEEDERDLRRDALKQEKKKRLKADPSADVSDLRSTAGDEPTARRYKANDSSYQALGELLRQNTNGLLVHRDELMSLLRALDREDNSEARGFYLTGWNGSDSYVFDRIGRGTNLYVPSVTISLLGSTQPALLQGYVRGVVGGGATDDGLLQRFSMTVWPDMPRNWTEHDREPHPDHRKRAFDAFDYLDRIGPEHVGAQIDAFEKSNPFLRFDDAGQEIFRDWRKAHEARLRSDELHPALESHLAKYRKMVPSLALIHHLASAQTGPVGELSVLSALAWADFLESHAHRIFGAGAAGAVDGAQAILRGLRSGKLEPRFSARDIQRRNWSPMGDDITKVKAALDLLDDHHWVRSFDVPTTTSGGRPTTIYTANPKGLSR